MLIVGNVREAVEADLVAGRFACPACPEGVLRPWGFARERSLRGGSKLQPRRAICPKKASGCGASQVLLPDVCLLRRVDPVEVIGETLRAVLVEGQLYTDVAARAGVPPDTVFEWLRRFRRRASAIATQFGRWLSALLPGRPLPERASSAAVHALEIIGATVRAASLVLGTRPAWSWASALSGGMLLANNTNSPRPSPE